MSARARRVLGARSALALLLAALVVAACGAARRGPTYPPAGSTPLVATSETAAARAAVIQALAGTGLVIPDAPQPYRPSEGPWLAAAPRTVVELDAPGGGPVGFVVLYGFASPADASAAGSDQASYVSRATTRVDFPNDARFTIRVLGTAVIFFAWSPGGGDARLGSVQAALEQLGTGVPLPA